MLGKDYADQDCSIARGLEVVGERWSLLVVRELATGAHRFDTLVENLGVTRSVLTARLRHLEGEGVLTRHRYSEHPPRDEYHLTEKGLALLPVLAHLLWWGDRYYPSPEGPPRRLLHTGCGGDVRARWTCGDCGALLGPEDVGSTTRAEAAAAKPGTLSG